MKDVTERDSRVLILYQGIAKQEVYTMKKRAVVALGHRALGTTLPEQMEAVKKSAVTIADLI